MKQILSFVFAGIIGGLVAVTAMKYVGEGNSNILYNQSPAASFVSDNDNSVFDKTSFDFIKASEISTPVVVQVHAEESKALARQRYENERRNFGGSIWDLFGGDFFGGNFLMPKNGSGSGVIVSEDGYIATNNHVVGFADNIKVTLQNGKVFKAVKVGTDPITDLAVIKIEASDLPTLRYGNSDNVKIGQWVLAVGNPFSYLTSTVTAGIVSAKGRDLDIIEGQESIVEFIQTDAAVNPGNSGGALVNADGELVGINTAIASPTGVYAGYSFAIPSNLVKEIVADIIENGDIRGNSLGIMGYDVDRQLADEEGLQVTNGFLIDSFVDYSIAEKAGAKAGDVIIGIDDNEIYDFDDLVSVMKRTKVGDTIDLIVNRNGKIKTISIKLKKKM